MDNEADGEQVLGCGPDLLDGWMARDEVAAKFGVSEDTLQRWQSRRIGPPVVRIGWRAFYRVEAIHAWMIDRERGPKVLKAARRGSRINTGEAS